MRRTEKSRSQEKMRGAELKKRENPNDEVHAAGEANLAPISEDHTGKSISSFYFRGTKYEVCSWRELLLKLCSILSATHGNEFDRIKEIAGTKRPYFARDESQLVTPRKISNTDFFAETNLSTYNTTLVCRRLIAMFGYRDEDLEVEVYTDGPKYTVTEKFRGVYSDLELLFSALEAKIREFGGNVEINVRKIHIAFKRKHSFAVMYIRKNRIDIGLSLDPSLESDRLKDATNWGWSRINKCVSVSEIGDIDEQLIAWLRQSYNRS